LLSERHDPNPLKEQELPLPRVVPSLFVRAVRCTLIIDRAFNIFDRLRSKIVLACAPDAFYDLYNDLAFGSENVFRAGNKAFRSGLFDFEERSITRHFPRPPGTVLVGAAGGGREALALANRGYRVVAFEPALPLASSLAQNCGELPIEIFLGRYEELPRVSSLTHPHGDIDLCSRAPFLAAILGWSSFSHLRSDDRCVETLRHFGRLTHGPILVSYFPATMGGSTAEAGARFSMRIGYYRTFSAAEIREFAERAGLEVIELSEEENWPHAVLQMPQTDAAPGLPKIVT
jgi:hypothetical protein